MNYQILISETFYNIFMFFVNVNEGKENVIIFSETFSLECDNES